MDYVLTAWILHVRQKNSQTRLIRGDCKKHCSQLQSLDISYNINYTMKHNIVMKALCHEIYHGMCPREGYYLKAVLPIFGFFGRQTWWSDDFGPQLNRTVDLDLIQFHNIDWTASNSIWKLLFERDSKGCSRTSRFFTFHKQIMSWQKALPKVSLWTS